MLCVLVKMCVEDQSVPRAFFWQAKRLELMSPKTTKTPPTIAQMLIRKRESYELDFDICIDTGENSKIIMTMLSEGCLSADFLLMVRA